MQIREINKNAAKILGRCLDGCAYHDVGRLARFLRRFQKPNFPRGRVHAYVVHNPELGREVAALQACAK